jgi:hypothetical protein
LFALQLIAVKAVNSKSINSQSAIICCGPGFAKKQMTNIEKFDSIEMREN